jgi:hypothetical protein
MFRSQILKAGFAALALGGAVLAWSGPVQAGASTGTWRNGMVMGPYGPGYYGAYGYSGRSRGYYGGYRGASDYDEPDCYTVRRRYVDDWGRAFVRRMRVCE